MKIDNYFTMLRTFILLMFIFILPLIASAQGLVPCGFDVNGDGKVKGPGEECTFNHFLIGINKVIDFLITITASIAALVFAYAGVLLLVSGGKEANVTKAKEMSWSVVKGLALMIAAWLLVKLVLTGLGIQPGFSLLR